MILLDTDVVSEPLRPAPDARVVAWIDAQAIGTLFLSAITVAELRAGVALLPPGKLHRQVAGRQRRPWLDRACRRAGALHRPVPRAGRGRAR